jgi:hypothetical protein
MTGHINHDVSGVHGTGYAKSGSTMCLASYRRVYHSVRSARAQYQENQKDKMTTFAFNTTVVYIQDRRSTAKKGWH